MLYNIIKTKIKDDLDCIDCQYKDKKTKKCNGLGKCCFEYDATTSTCIDPITKLPFNPNEIGGE